MANAEQALGVACRFGGDLLGGSANGARYGSEDVRQEGRLVAPRLRWRMQVARREVGRIRLEQQPIGGNVAHEREQMATAALVADPAGDADVEAELEIGVQLLLLAGEAMRHGVLHAVRAQDLREARMRVARMQEERLADLEAELELRDEPFLLVGMRRIVAVEVEAAFADRDAARMRRELTQLAERRVIAVARMVRMDAGRAVEVQPIGDLGREPALEHRGAGGDDRADARAAGAADHRIEVLVEARVRQIRADVDELHGAEYSYAVSRRSCSARSMPAAAKLSANAERGPTRGAASHSRKQRRPPGSAMKSTRAAQFTAKSRASLSAVARTRAASARSPSGSRRARRRYLRAKEYTAPGGSAISSGWPTRGPSTATVTSV